MKKRALLRLIFGLALCGILLCCACAALADTPRGHVYTPTSFTVTSMGNASLTLAQSGQGTIKMLNRANAYEFRMESSYGKYTVEYSNGRDSGTVDWQSDRCTLNLLQTGIYTIWVTPYSTLSMQNATGSYYYSNGVQGYYTYASWATAPTWTVESMRNCTYPSYAYTQNTATPTLSANCAVYYRSYDGSLLGFTIRTLRGAGEHAITAEERRGEYALSGQSTVTVTVDGNGRCLPDAVTFYYDKSAASIPVAPVTTPAPTYYYYRSATVPVYYRDLNTNAVLYSENRTLSYGSHTVTPVYQPKGYLPLGNTSVNVTVDQNGAAQPASVTFYYITAATPTPEPKRATISVDYRLPDNTLLRQDSKTLTAGTHTIKNEMKTGAYLLMGPSSYTVTVSADGVPSVNTVTFYFTVNESWSSTDMTAVIGADLIYPRPGPNSGKNEYNYAAKGQTVYVHSRALSQKGDGKWWVCISGDIRCWGNTYTLDHVWIGNDYLDPNSYELFDLPIDPNYT